MRSRAIAVAVVAGILVVTLVPRPGVGGGVLGFCLVCGERGTSDFLLNVALFAPLGMALRLAGWRVGAAALAGLLLSGFVEALQFVVPGRHPTVADLIANTLGAGTGAILFGALSTWRERRGAPRWAAPLWTAALLAWLAASASLLRPSLPETAYWGQWTPELGHLEAYAGRVLEASVGERRVPGRRLPDGEAVRRELLAGGPVRALTILGDPPAALAPVFSIFDEHQREIMLLGADGDDVVFRRRTLARALRMDSPPLIATGLLSGATGGDTLLLTIAMPCASAGQHVSCPGEISAARSWAFLRHTQGLSRWIRSALDAGWLAVLFLPVGALAGGAGVGAALGAAALGGLAVTPLLGWPSAVPAVGWAGALAGLAVGLATGRRLRAGASGPPDIGVSAAPPARSRRS